MSTISVKLLNKEFHVNNKNRGIFSIVKSFIKPDIETVKALDDVSFEIRKGELVGFIGPNGAGKTTTLKCLSGLLYPTHGNLEVLGFEPYKRETAYLKKISLIMGQKNQLWWDLPAIDTFKLNKEIYEINDHNYKKNLEELVSILEVGKEIDTPVRKLSLGQRMKMELIAALLHSPEVLFLDEPTIGLDVVMQKKMRDFIASYNINKMATIILTSHYIADVRTLCKRLIIINKGRIIYDGSFDKLINKYAGHKLLTVTFNKSVNKSDLVKFGHIKSFTKNKLILEVERKTFKKTSSMLLNRYPVEDFNIEDPEVEDIIRSVFEGSHHK